MPVMVVSQPKDEPAGADPPISSRLTADGSIQGIKCLPVRGHRNIFKKNISLNNNNTVRMVTRGHVCPYTLQLKISEIHLYECHKAGKALIAMETIKKVFKRMTENALAFPRCVSWAAI